MKKSQIKTVPDDKSLAHNALSKGKQKQNSKSLSKKTPQTQKSPRPSAKTPPKQLANKKETNKSHLQKQVNKKNGLFLIPEVTDNSQDSLKLNAIRQNVSFTREDKSQDKKKEDDFEFDQRYPNFERSSFKLSEKQYHVSLAGSMKTQNQTHLVNGQSKKLQRKRTLSASPVKTRHQFETEQQIDEWLAANLKKTNNQSVKKISEQFKQHIEQPLKIQDQLSNSANPIQRCLAHNTPFSLYCSIDRQLLCVSCIYSQKTHKNHQIFPLAKSQKEMKEDMDGFRNRVDATLAQSESLIRQASLNLIKIEKEYPILLKRIDSYYTSIHALIDEKKAEQIEYIENLREENKKELKTINGLLNKISNIFQNKLKQIERQSKLVSKEVYYAKNMSKSQESQGTQQNLQENSSEMYLNSIIKHRCEYEILSRFHRILTKNSDMLFQEKKGFHINLQNFQGVADLIKYKLAIVVPVMKKDESRKPWIVELLGEEGARQVGVNNMHYRVEVRNKKDLDRSQYREEGSSMKNNENKGVVHRKGFSTSPQVPKGILRRFL